MSTPRILAAIAAVLLCLSLSASASVASQFRFNPYGEDVSRCFTECNEVAVGNIQVDFSVTGRSYEFWIIKNCQSKEYLDAIKLCIPTLCPTSWDAQYAVEFGTAFCKKAGVKVDLALPASYTSTAGGFFATAVAADLVSRGSREVILNASLLILASVVGLCWTAL